MGRAEDLVRARQLTREAEAAQQETRELNRRKDAALSRLSDDLPVLLDALERADFPDATLMRIDGKRPSERVAWEVARFEYSVDSSGETSTGRWYLLADGLFVTDRITPYVTSRRVPQDVHELAEAFTTVPGPYDRQKQATIEIIADGVASLRSTYASPAAGEHERQPAAERRAALEEAYETRKKSRESLKGEWISSIVAALLYLAVLGGILYGATAAMGVQPGLIVSGIVLGYLFLVGNSEYGYFKMLRKHVGVLRGKSR